MKDTEASNILSDFETMYSLPTTDLIRFGDSSLIKPIYNLI